ncbi:hypothetical protein [Stetteria hydrogenophila]
MLGDKGKDLRDLLLELRGIRVEPVEEQLEGDVDDIRKLIDRLASPIKGSDVYSNPKVKELGKAIYDVHYAFSEALDTFTELPKDSALAYYARYIMPRFTFGINLSAFLCRVEAVDSTVRQALEYLMKATVLDFDREYRDWPLEKKLRWLLGYASSQEEKKEIMKFSERSSYMGRFMKIMKMMAPNKVKVLEELLEKLYDVPIGGPMRHTLNRLIRYDEENAGIAKACTDSDAWPDLTAIREIIRQYTDIHLMVVRAVALKVVKKIWEEKKARGELDGQKENFVVI